MNDYNANTTSIQPKLASAFVKFQSQVHMISKSKTAKGANFSYRYAEFADVVEAIREPMAACGLAFYQKVSSCDTHVRVTTYLIHESGETLECGTVSLKIMDPNPQKVGTLISYARRYSLSTGIGLATEEDTDCVETRGITGGPSPKRNNTEESPQRNFQDICESMQVPVKHRNRILKHFGSPGKAHAFLSSAGPEDIDRVTGNNIKQLEPKKGRKNLLEVKRQRRLSGNDILGIMFYKFNMDQSEVDKVDYTDSQMMMASKFIQESSDEQLQQCIEEARKRKESFMREREAV